MNENDSTTPEVIADSPLIGGLLAQINNLIIERDALATQVRDNEHKVIQDVDVAYYNARTALVKVLTFLVEADALEKSDAFDIFQRFCEELGKTWKNPFQNTWAVHVKHCYDLVMTVTGVEGEDEDEAISEVSDNLSISDPRMVGCLEYSGSGDADDAPSIEEELNYWDIHRLDLTYEAIQE